MTDAGLTKTIGGKGGGSIGVGAGDIDAGDTGVRGWADGVYARGTKPAARMLGETMYRASTAPCECRASRAWVRFGLPKIRPEDVGEGVEGIEGTELPGVETVSDAE